MLYPQMTAHIVPHPIRLEHSPEPEFKHRSQTPLRARFALLSPGTFPPNALITSAALATFRQPLSIAPYHPYGSVENDGFLENPQSGSHPRICQKGVTKLLLKARQLEAGTPPCIKAGINPLNPDDVYHFPPGTGPFIEVLVAKYMRHCMNHVSIKGQPLPVVPEIGYGQIGDVSMCLLQKGQSSISTRGTFSFQRLIPHCKTFTQQMALHRTYYDLTCAEKTILDEFYFGINPITLEIMAALDMATLAGDRHGNNVLISDLRIHHILQTEIVLIDHARSFSVEGKRLKFFWIHCIHLQKPPSQVIKNFIRALNDTDLETIADDLKKEIQTNLRHLPPIRQQDEEKFIELPLERLLPHKIAIAYLKQAVEKDVPLACIGFAMRGPYHRYLPHCEGGSIYRIYQELQTIPPEERISSIPRAVAAELERYMPSCDHLPKQDERDPLSFDSKKETPPPAITEEASDLSGGVQNIE